MKKLLYALGLLVLLLSVFQDGYKHGNGLALSIRMERDQVGLDEAMAVNIKLHNYGDAAMKITVPGDGGGMALVTAQHQSEKWQGMFKTDGSVPEQEAINGVYVYTIGPNETVEQKFRWNQRVLDQIGPGELPAPSGEYTLHAAVIVGDITEVPLTTVTTSLPFTILGERDQLSYHEARELALGSDSAKQWFIARTYDQLVKQERGEWHVKDIDGRWVPARREQLESLKGWEPRFIGGERAGDQVMMHFESSLGGPPHRMTVTIDRLSGEVTAVEFADSRA